jgi:hypothetical protein
VRYNKNSRLFIGRWPKKVFLVSGKKWIQLGVANAKLIHPNHLRVPTYADTASTETNWSLPVTLASGSAYQPAKDGLIITQEFFKSSNLFFIKVYISEEIKHC